ncbi:hypothetical protein CALCODRAFT_438976, partial [Calocera cornea HHB12733]
MGTEAAIWPVYNEVAEKYDKEMLETYNGGMDNLLIFFQAALFSAVVTAFLILSLPLLQADPAQATLDALTAVSAQLAAMHLNSTPATPYYEQPSASPSALPINVLWIASLLLSLTTSVLAMLVKQWLRIFITNLPAAARERATERQARLDGLQSWQVANIADALPVSIHLAVAFFFIGLI